MVLMKVVSSSVSRQVRVEALGSAMAASRAGTSAAISGLRITLPTWGGSGGGGEGVRGRGGVQRQQAWEYLCQRWMCTGFMGWG
jgi:hypothetical protein